MTRKRNITAIILSAIMALSACCDHPDATTAEKETPSAEEYSVITAEATEYSDETPAAAETTVYSDEVPSSFYDNRSVIWNSNFVETDTTIYSIQHFGGNLIFWEKETGIGGPLCGKPDGLYEVKEGTLEKYEILVPDEKYDLLVISKGIAIACGADPIKEGDRTINTNYYMIRKWDGTVLYEGELPTEFQNDISEDWSFHAVFSIFGDENAVCVEFEWMKKNYKRMTTEVRYEITSAGLKEQLIWTTPEY